MKWADDMVNHFRTYMILGCKTPFIAKVLKIKELCVNSKLQKHRKNLLFVEKILLEAIDKLESTSECKKSKGNSAALSSPQFNT